MHSNRSRKSIGTRFIGGLAALATTGLLAYTTQASALPAADSEASSPPPAAPAPPAKPTGRAAFARPASIAFPKDNAYSPQRELLGRTLFFDPRLSGSEAISCASCHNPGFA